ncbi:MAG: uracil phosphoribosyltransferase [Deltaproteobacteria bacterium]|nr:uracil phosphoribosyltransferase [Deltaproteobacteria bacterium]
MSEIEERHYYGGNVHLINDVYYHTLLANLSTAGSAQPQLNLYLRTLYEGLLRFMMNRYFPKKEERFLTRMNAALNEKILDPETEVVTVDIARAGILPSMVCFEMLSSILPPSKVRQDHIIINRVVNTEGQVTGAAISGTKVGGPVDGKILIFPDPMGATGSSLCEVLKFYLAGGSQKPAAVISLNLIITPEFIRRVLSEYPGARIAAYRLDRGLSPKEVLSLMPGEKWELEKGLNEHDYIIPGAGGLGEVLNNSFV